MREDEQRRRRLRFTECQLTTVQQLAGTRFGRGRNPNSPILKLGEALGVFDDEDRRRAEIAGLIPENGATIAPSETLGLNGATIVPSSTASSSAKGELLYWYLETLLPKIAAKGTIFAVLIALWKESPDDLSTFAMSNRKLAKEAGVNLRRIPDAIRQLEKLGVVLVVREGKWSRLGPQAAVVPEYNLVPLGKIK